MKPKILLCVPYYRIIEQKCKDALDAMQIYEKKRDAIICGYTDLDSALLSHARNYFCNLARDMACSHVLMIDSDTVFPPDSIERLLAHDKDIVCAITCARGDQTGRPLGEGINTNQISTSKGQIFGSAHSFPDTDLSEMEKVSCNMILLKTSIFNKIIMPAFHDTPDYITGNIMGEDYTFCQKLRDKGFQLWCDIGLSKQVGHIDYRDKKVYYPKF